MTRIALLSCAWLALVAGGTSFAGDAAGSAPRWEYRVLGKAEVLELGKSDLATGLNRLGRDGWELAAIDGAYIFKRRPTGHMSSVEHLKELLAAAESDLQMRKERVTWAERMARKGFLSASQLEADRTLLQRSEIEVGQLRRDLDAARLPSPKQAPKEQ
jgi:hypothetical protein